MATTIIRYRSGKAWSQKQIEYPTLEKALEEFTYIVNTHKKDRIGDMSIDGKPITKQELIDAYLNSMQSKLTMFE